MSMRRCHVECIRTSYNEYDLDSESEHRSKRDFASKPDAKGDNARKAGVDIEDHRPMTRSARKQLSLVPGRTLLGRW